MGRQEKILGPLSYETKRSNVNRFRGLGPLYPQRSRNGEIIRYRGRSFLPKRHLMRHGARMGEAVPGELAAGNDIESERILRRISGRPSLRKWRIQIFYGIVRAIDEVHHLLACSAPRDANRPTDR